MRTVLKATLLALALSGMILLATPADAQVGKSPAEPATQQTDVPVKVVVLFSSGVGYFEHIGSIKGDSSTELRFKTNQVNDILKSLILEDMGKGKVTAVVYPSQDPIGKMLRSFQVDITGNPALWELLSQLRGAKVKMTVAAEQVEGTILGVEKKQKPVGDKGTIEVPVVNIISGASIRAVELDQVAKLELQDAQLQEELNKALVALTQARDQDKKPVTINFAGEGERMVRIGYVVETPVWKSSYRLLLPAKPDDKPKLQGWAIVENQSDNDWNNVQLSLVSGRPISFIQDLYSPLYIPRPVVQPELYASLRPQTYDAGIGRQNKEEEAADLDKMKTPPPPPTNAPAKPMGASGGLARGVMDDGKADNADRTPIDASRSVASVASASKIGELFQYTVGNVSLPRQRSAMIPIVTDDVEVEKVSIYNASVLPRNPLNGAKVKNTTGKHLLQGPITVLDGSSYAGDARIDNVPPGQDRLLSYGIDLQMLVDATKNATSTSIRSGKIVRGILELTHKYEYTQDYAAENKGDKDKVLIVEHPRRQGITLVDPAKPAEMTDAVYRFRVAVPSGKSASLSVKEEQVTAQSIAILPADIGQFEVYAKSDRISKTVREALAEAIKRKSAMVDTERQVADLRRQVADITAEQGRIRENIKTVAQNSQYATRLLTKLNDQETILEKTTDKIDEANKTLRQQQKDLEDYLLNLNVDEK